MWDSVLKKRSFEALYDFCCSVSWLYVHKVRSAVNPSCDSGSCSASSKFKRYTSIIWVRFECFSPFSIFFMFKGQILLHVYNMLLIPKQLPRALTSSYVDEKRVERMEALPTVCVCVCTCFFFACFFSRALPVAKTFHSLRSSIRQTFMTTLTLDPRAPLLSLIIRRWTVGCFRGGSDEVSLRPVDSFSPAS